MDAGVRVELTSEQKFYAEWIDGFGCRPALESGLPGTLQPATHQHGYKLQA